MNRGLRRSAFPLSLLAISLAAAVFAGVCPAENILIVPGQDKEAEQKILIVPGQSQGSANMGGARGPQGSTVSHAAKAPPPARQTTGASTETRKQQLEQPSRHQTTTEGGDERQQENEMPAGHGIRY